MPKTSIIIATRDRNELLEKTLISLSCQTSKSNFEVLVCDDGGTSDTKSLVENFSNRINIKYFWLPDSGGYCWAQAKNHGAKKSHADYLLFMDDDMLLPPDAISKMYSWLTRFPQRKNRCFVTPNERLYVRYDFPDKLIAEDYDSIKKYNIENYSNNISIGCTGLISKKVFFKINCFDQILFKGLQLGDTDIIKRLQGFLGVTQKVLGFNTYHLDNNPFRNERNLIAIRRKSLAKQLIREKLSIYGFRLVSLDDTPKKDFSKFEKGHYGRILEDHKYQGKVSRDLRRRLDLYDHEKNHLNFSVKKTF